MLNVSHTQTLHQRRIQSPCRVSIAQNPSARPTAPVLLEANDPFYGCLTFGTLDVTEAPDSAIFSRVSCPEPFGKTQKSSFNAGERSLLWLLNVSDTQTLRQRQIQPFCPVYIAHNPSARLTNPVLMPANDPFCCCLAFRTLTRNGSAEFSRPVAFPLPRTLRQDSEI